MDARKVCCYQHFSVIVVDVLQLLQVERSCIELSDNMLTLIVALATAVHNLAKQLASFTVPRATFSKQNQGHVTNNNLQIVAVISVYETSRQVIMSSRCVRNAMTSSQKRQVQTSCQMLWCSCSCCCRGRYWIPFL